MPRFDRLPPAVRMFLVTMASIAFAECTVMVLLDNVFPTLSGWRATVLDVLLLCSFVSPILWFAVLYPLRTRALRELARSHAIIDSSSDAIITVGAGGLIESFNPAATRLFGWTEHEAVGQPFEILIAESEREHHRKIFGAEARGPNASFPHILGEVASVRRDGSGFVADLTLGAFPSGHRLTIAAILRDATERKMAHELLQTRERYFQSLLSHSADVIVVAGVDGRLEYANPALQRALGVRIEEWLGQSVFGLVWPEDVGQAEAVFGWTLQSDGDAIAWQLRLRHANGTPRWFEGRATYNPADPAGAGIVVNCRDITDRKEADDRLSTLSRAIAQSPASVVITDPDGNIEYVNPKFCDLTGYTFDEVRGKNPRLLGSGETPAETYRQLWRDVLAGREWRGRFHNRKKGGELYWEHASISPIVDEAGTITHLLAVKEDLTERELSKAALAVSEERFQQAFANAPIGMALVSPDGRWLKVNHALCELVGYSAAELLTGMFQDITHPDDLEADLDYVRQVLEGSIATYEMEKRYIHKLGDEIWVQLNVSLIVDGDGRPLYFVSQVQDITARKAARATLEGWAQELESTNKKLHEEQSARAKVESELRLAQKLEAIGQLAAGIAHEINTPMQYIGDSARYLVNAFGDVQHALAVYQGAADRLGRIPGHEEVVAEVGRVLEQTDLEFAQEEIPRALDRVLDGTARVTGIVRAMKEFAHPDQRERTASDLNHMLLTTLTVARNEYKHVADVETDLGELPPLPCNVGELNQVFLNLIVNAAHAVADVVAQTQSKGRIAIRTRLDEGFAVVEISDTGGGITESIRERVFDPFFTTKPVGRGSGQGLAIARAIVVDKHGGTLTFKSEVGRGTTFTVRLPVEQQREIQEAA